MGHARAQNNLGIRYRNGEGVKRDYAKAVKWFRKAAEQGHVDAQNSLAVRYKHGQGVPKDMVQCLAWRIIASEQGSLRAFEWKRKDSVTMIPADIAKAKKLAKEWMEKNPKLVQ